MSIGRRSLLAASVLAALPWRATAQAASGKAPIRIGELNSYKALPAFLEPYKKGMQLALTQINAAGGIDGRPLELVIREDNANPGDAVRAAEELVTREKVDLIAGTFLSNVGMAVADFAQQKKVLFLAGEPLTDKLTWEGGNRYAFRLRPGTYMQAAMLAPEAAKLNKRRWALVYPNYEYGQAAVAAFKTLLKTAQPDVQFVAEQATPQGKVDAGAVAQALADARPDAIFNVLFATDLTRFVREGNTRGLFTGRPVVSLLSGEPEYLDPLKAETPEGWIVTGYPWQSIHTPEHDAFLQPYRAQYGDYPRMGSVVGYSLIQSAAAGLRKAAGGGVDALIAAFEGLPVATPFGPITFRAQDHQSTLGTFVGRTHNDGGRGVLVDAVYCDGARFQPPPAQIRRAA